MTATPEVDPGAAGVPALGADFRRFFIGQGISQFGSSFTQFATPLVIYQLTHSALNLGIATAVVFVPYLLFGLVIGAWMDRLDRKRTMIVVDVARAAVIATIPLLAHAHALHPWHVYAVGFVSSTLTIFFDAGEFAAIPSLVGETDLVTANGRVQATYSAAAVIGPVLAGVLLTLLSVPSLFLVDAGSFLVSAGALVAVRRSFNAGPPAQRSSIRVEVSEGLRYVLRHPVLRNISLMMASINVVSTAATAQLVFFAKTRLAATNSGVAFVFAAGSVGVVVLGLVAGKIRRRLRFGPAALGALMLSGLVMIAFAENRALWIALPLLALEQGLGTFFNINTASLRQTIVPNHLLGRISSIAAVLAWSAIPVGSLAGGFAVRATNNVALVFGVCGALQCAIAALFYFASPLGHAEDHLGV